MNKTHKCLLISNVANPPAHVGDRVTLIQMNNDPHPIPPGSEGTVTRICKWVGGEWNIGVRWDSGRTLGLVYPEDKFIARTPEKKT